MKKQLRILMLPALVLFAMPAPAQGGKADLLKQFQQIQAQVLEIARQNKSTVPRQDLTDEIDKIIHTDLLSEQLFRLGITLCLSGEPRRHDDNTIDNVFFYASNRCALLLSERSGEKIRHYLERMKTICGNDQGDVLFYDGLIEKQKEL